MVTGKTGKFLGAASAGILNALKALANIDDNVDLISPTVIAPIQDLKVDYMGSKNPRLHTDEILISLAMSAVSDPMAERAMKELGNLKGAQLHCTVTLSSVDEVTFKKLGVGVTYEPFSTKAMSYTK